ncbi:hypothetical protein NDU88_000515 [Pleurodeles waltl]|uniref:Uncharacterized protein n=1 Tax=Pleurodeles waltl TaxID=8319 RepID=A0AAV7Q363_PLEWA|nr:hypothetical protein NDU88_000515 [Pleurodeles waltl]
MSLECARSSDVTAPALQQRAVVQLGRCCDASQLAPGKCTGALDTDLWSQKSQDMSPECARASDVTALALQRRAAVQRGRCCDASQLAPGKCTGALDADLWSQQSQEMSLGCSRSSDITAPALQRRAAVQRGRCCDASQPAPGKCTGASDADLWSQQSQDMSLECAISSDVTAPALQQRAVVQLGRCCDASRLAPGKCTGALDTDLWSQKSQDMSPECARASDVTALALALQPRAAVQRGRCCDASQLAPGKCTGALDADLWSQQSQEMSLGCSRSSDVTAPALQRRAAVQRDRCCDASLPAPGKCTGASDADLWSQQSQDMSLECARSSDVTAPALQRRAAVQRGRCCDASQPAPGKCTGASDADLWSQQSQDMSLECAISSDVTAPALQQRAVVQLGRCCDASRLAPGKCTGALDTDLWSQKSQDMSPECARASDVTALALQPRAAVQRGRCCP